MYAQPYARSLAGVQEVDEMTQADTRGAIVADATVDLGETGCGDLTPLIRGRIRELQSGQVLEVISEEPAAREGIPAWSRLTGNELVATFAESGRTRFFIRKK
jgi:tRNA 2-thiouridine synthesizing protein A